MQMDLEVLSLWLNPQAWPSSPYHHWIFITEQSSLLPIANLFWNPVITRHSLCHHSDSLGLIIRGQAEGKSGCRATVLKGHRLYFSLVRFSTEGADMQGRIFTLETTIIHCMSGWTHGQRLSNLWNWGCRPGQGRGRQKAGLAPKRYLLVQSRDSYLLLLPPQTLTLPRRKLP